MSGSGAAPGETLSAPGADVRVRALPSLIHDGLSLVWRAARREFVAATTLQLLASVALAVQLFVGRRLLATLLGAGHQGLPGAGPSVVLLTIAVAVMAASNFARYEVSRLLGELVSRYAVERVTTAAAATPLLEFEDPAHHDKLLRAIVNASSRPLQLATGAVALIGSIASSLAISVALLTIQPLLCLFSLAAVVPFFLANIVAGRALYQFSFHQTERDRRRLYLQTLLTQRDAAKEVRSYRLAEHLRQEHRELYKVRLQDLRAVVRKRLIRGVAQSVATSILAGCSLLVLIWLTDSGRISLASAATAAGALLVLGSQLQTLSSGIGALYESSLFVQDFTSFIAEPVPPDPGATLLRADSLRQLRAEHVTFRYPGGKEDVLRGVDVRIDAGQVVALVGENGSGKSTLSKILAGLYEPTSGNVSWNDASFAAYDAESVSDQIAVLFQDFARYQMTASRNISLGRWDRPSVTRVRESAETVAADGFLAGLPDGYSTQLGPEFFGGVDLSGGQWQRIAFARAYYRDASLVILDEPTAALDARAEAELFASMRSLFRGRAVLLTSHRFASVRLADFIYVLSDGRVVEQGVHDELIAQRGLYAELYSLQAAAFID